MHKVLSVVLAFLMVTLMVIGVAQAGSLIIDGEIGANIDADIQSEGNYNTLTLKHEQSDFRGHISATALFDIGAMKAGPTAFYAELHNVYNEQRYGLVIMPLESVPIGLQATYNIPDVEAGILAESTRSLIHDNWTVSLRFNHTFDF